MKKTKKLLSVLLSTALMASAILVPSAAFASEAASINGSYKFVKAEIEQAAGSVKFTKDSSYSAADKIYYEINLPDGVTVTEGKEANVTATSVLEKKVTDSSVSGTIAPAEFEKGTASIINFNQIDVDADVTGNVVAESKIWGYNDSNGVAWEVNANVTIAKINTGSVTISAGKAQAVSVGAAQEGAKVTIKETTPGALNVDDEIIFTILSSGVKWDTGATDYTDNSDIFAKPEFTGDDDNKKNVKFTVKKQSTGSAAKLEVIPAFKVAPGTTGDIKVKVSGDVESTEAVVATVGQGSVDVTVKDNTNNVFIGTKNNDLDTEITLDPQTEFKGEDYFTLTLPKGFKWEACSINGVAKSNLTLEDKSLDGDRTAWFVFKDDQTAKVKLTDLSIAADYNAPVGDIKVTAAGAVKGDIVIGKAVAPVTITADKVNLPLKGANVPGGKITIVENAAGALYHGGYLDLQLPMGATFAKLPAVEVTNGDLELDGTDVGYGDDDKSSVWIHIGDASNVASTIVLTELQYNVDNRAATNNNFQISYGSDLNQVSHNALGSFAAGSIISETASTSTFVIGSTSYTVNGQTKTLDSAPYIKDDRTFLPLRFVATAAGVTDENIVWNAADQSVVIIKGDRIVKLNIGSKTMYVNGIAVQMDTAPEITNSRTMLPVRWVGQALGASINWDAATKTVTVEVK